MMKDIALYKELGQVDFHETQKDSLNEMLEGYRGRIFVKFRTYYNLACGKARWLRPFLFFMVSYLVVWIYVKALFGSEFSYCEILGNALFSIAYAGIMSFLWYKLIK